jgi:hypothetical protein
VAIERIIAGALLGPALFVGAVPAVAAPKEPLVVTQMADPDPYFVPTRVEGRRDRDTAGEADGNSRIEEAMQTFGRAIGQAALVEQQQIEAKCRQGETESATPEQRFAWAASCRYSRH